MTTKKRFAEAGALVFSCAQTRLFDRMLRKKVVNRKNVGDPCEQHRYRQLRRKEATMTMLLHSWWMVVAPKVLRRSSRLHGHKEKNP